MLQRRNRDNLRKELNKMEISNLLDKVFKVMILKGSLNVGEEQVNSGRISTELENIKKNKPELKNIVP